MKNQEKVLLEKVSPKVAHRMCGGPGSQNRSEVPTVHDEDEDEVTSCACLNRDLGVKKTKVPGMLLPTYSDRNLTGTHVVQV